MGLWKGEALSGGAYVKVEDMARELEKHRDPLRRAFAEHLFAVSKAMYDVEWVDSGDYSPGAEHEAIRIVIDRATTMSVLVDTLRDVADHIQRELKRLE
jgi:hypothetical protein